MTLCLRALSKLSLRTVFGFLTLVNDGLWEKIGCIYGSINVSAAVLRSVWNRNGLPAGMYMAV